MIDLLIISFIAGIITIFSPCIFTLLPVIIGGTSQVRNLNRIIVITTVLGITVFVFTLLLKSSTLLIEVEPIVWKLISGGIILLLGLNSLFPHSWDRISNKFLLRNVSTNFLQYGFKQNGILRDIFIGAALGPVFSSCSPTYSLIIATILPVDFIKGIIYILVYCAGLTLILFLIGVFGQTLTQNLKWAVNPKGIFNKLLGLIFILTGLMIITGLDKTFESYLTESGLFNNIVNFEINLISK